MTSLWLASARSAKIPAGRLIEIEQDLLEQRLGWLARKRHAVVEFVGQHREPQPVGGLATDPRSRRRPSSREGSLQARSAGV